MNKIYKVIWNKTRGMYMVVSELAKGQSKDGRRAVGRKKVAQTAAALALFFSIVSMGGTSFAADTTKVDSSTSGTAVEVYTKDGTDSKAAELDTRITNVKEYLEKQTSENYVSKTDAAVQDAGVVKANKKIGENVTALGKGLYDETAARIGADAAQDKVIQAVNDNLVQSVTTINKNVSDGFTALNQADAKEAADREAKDNELSERITNEANEIHKTTNQLQSDLNTETAAREAGDTALNTRITNVKEYLEQQTSDKYVSKADAAVQDGAVVKANKTIGENVTNLDAALASETAARIGADKAQDKVIQTVNDNLVQSVNTINQNMSAGFDALSQADANELAGRVAADTELAKAVNNGLSLDQDNVLQKNTTSVGEDGTVTTSKEAATTLVMNKDGNNQITLSENGIKVGLNSTVQDANGFYAGGDTAAAAKAALNADGSIKGADGKFTVDTAGNVATKGGSIKTNGGVIQTGGGNINTQGGAINGGAITGTSINGTTGTFGSLETTGNTSVAGTLTSHGINNTGNTTTDSLTVKQGATVGGSLAVTGDITGKSLSVTGDITGKQITGTGLDVGAGLIKTTGSVETGTLETTGNATIGGNLTVDKNLTVNGEFNAKTLSSKLDENNYTEIHGGNVTSVNSKVDTTDGKTYTSTATLTEKGKTETASNGINRNVEKMDATESSDVISNDANGQTSTFRQKIDQILQEIKTSDEIYSKIDQTVNRMNSTVRDGANSTSVEQGTQDITHTAEQGTISNIAKDLVNTSTGDMTNTVGGKMLNDVTGDMENKVGGNLTTTVGGNQTTTVAGDSSLKAENITNEAKNKITNKAIDVETDATSSIVQKVTNDAGSNTSTQLSYQTKEEMSQADGKTASYLRGAAEEKSQLIDGSQKTTIDTIAGQTNTNITDGTNTSNDLQKADQIASSVTDGTNTTVVNQNAGSLASSITDGAKVNNSSNTVDKSEQRIQASDTQYSATSKTATKTEDALVSGSSVIDVIKSLDDAANPFIGSAVTDGTNITVVTQTAKDITNTAKNGTIANEAKDITNHATENMTNTVGKDLSTTVGGNQTTTVTGDSSLTAENITNTATEKLSNAAAEIENSASKSITDKVGANVERTMTTKKISESVKDGTKSNSFSKTAEKDINIIADGTNTSTLSQLADSVNTSLKNGTQSLNNTKTVTEDVTKVTDKNTGAFSSSSQKADAMTNTVKNGSKSNTVTEKASTSEQKLVSGNIIDILKDAEHGYVNTTVRSGTGDDATSTSVKQETADITNTAKQGTITNEAKKLVNKAEEKLSNSAAEIENTATTSIKDVVGKSTVTTTDTGTTFENSDHAEAIGEGSITQTTISGNTLETGKVTADYVDVNKDLSVGGNVTASSYKVGDKTYIDENGINANGQKVTNVADGTIAEGSTDAVNGGQLHQTNQRVATVENRMDGVENRMDRVETRVDNLDNRIDKVGANAAAMANLHPMDFDEDSKVSVAAAVGNYRSETAGALGVFYRPTDRVMLNVSTSFGNGENMIGGGVSFKLGKSSKRLEKAEATNAALAKQVTNLQNRLDALLGVLNPSLSKDFPDVPANHWAYEAVSRLAGNDIIQGYEDGKYHGERTMTRYEMAEIIYNALSKGAKAEAKLVEEFRPELQAMAAQRKA